MTWTSANAYCASEYGTQLAKFAGGGDDYRQAHSDKQGNAAWIGSFGNCIGRCCLMGKYNGVTYAYCQREELFLCDEPYIPE